MFTIDNYQFANRQGQNGEAGLAREDSGKHQTLFPFLKIYPARPQPKIIFPPYFERAS
jgi:hypothetical protein